MLRRLLIAVCFFLPLPAFAQTLDGDWHGLMHAPGGELGIMVHFETRDGVLHAAMTSVDQSPVAMTADSATFDMDQVRFSLAQPRGTYQGTLSPDGKTITGAWMQGGASLPLTLTPGTITQRKLVRDAQPGDLTLATPTGTLAGTIWKADGGRIAALILTGSGPANRNGDSVTNGGRGIYRMIAEGLRERGITALSIDKRGIGESAAAMPGENMMRVQTYGDDARLWAAELKKRAGVRCVWLVGHSEGALVAELAAKDNRDICGLVTLAGVGRPMGVLLREQLGPKLDEAHKAQAFAIIASLEAGKTMASPPELAAMFRPSVQPYMMSEINLDPAAMLRELKIPVLIVQGDADVQVSVADAHALAAARADATLKILPGVNHSQRIAAEDKGTGQGPLAPGEMDIIADFLKAQK